MKKKDTLLWLVIILLIVLCACQLVFFFSDSKKIINVEEQSETAAITTESEGQPAPRFISFSRPHESTAVVPGETIKISGQIAGLFDGTTTIKITDQAGTVALEQPAIISQSGTNGVYDWTIEAQIPQKIKLGSAYIVAEFVSAVGPDSNFTSMREIEITQKHINQSLDGTWQFVSTYDQDGYPESVVDGISLRMTLAHGKVSGRSACNSFSGSYSVISDNAVEFGPLTTTRMACGDEDMSFETNQLGAFGRAAMYVINSNNELRFFDASSQPVATYSRVIAK